MPFRTDGSSHRDGIRNEEFITTLLHSIPQNVFDQRIAKEQDKEDVEGWSVEGGTKQQADSRCHFTDGTSCTISIKNHKNEGGTFDWANTTTCIPSELNEWIHYFKSKNKDRDITPEIRNEFADFVDAFFEEFDEERIGQLINDLYHHTTDYIIINNVPDRELILTKKNPLDILSKLEDGCKLVFKKKNAKNSRTIWIDCPDGMSINTNLRLRLTLNNGITALLGKSKANKNSKLCFKLQQENVGKLIETLEDRTVLKY